MAKNVKNGQNKALRCVQLSSKKILNHAYSSGAYSKQGICPFVQITFVLSFPTQKNFGEVTPEGVQTRAQPIDTQFFTNTKATQLSTIHYGQCYGDKDWCVSDLYLV